MKSISIVFALLITLCHLSKAASLAENPEITAAFSKFKAEYESLKDGFTTALSRKPSDDPAYYNSKIMKTIDFYSSMFLIHIQHEDYGNSFLAGKVDIEHILGLAKVSKAWPVTSNTGHTKENVYFLSQVLTYHQSVWRETKLPLEYAQRIAIEQCALHAKVLALTAENRRLKTALAQSGIEIWP